MVNASFLSPAAPAPLPDAALVARGKTLFEEKCRKCHQDELVQQQRLGKPGWTREVEKMTRWGAEVSEEEKNALVEYLATEFGTKKKS